MGSLIVICILLLVAYTFDLSSKLTKIPSVFLLIILGAALNYFSKFFFIQVPDFSYLLPILGTIGLILIVLESSLELEINSSKVPVIKRPMIMSLAPMLFFAFVFSLLLTQFYDISYKMALINIIPFSVISSAIAIPSAGNLSRTNKEFVVYESSLSDVFGILLFNFIILNQVIDATTIGHFAFQFFIMVIVSVLLVLFLSFLMSRIKHHVTYTPIVLIIILIYCASKIYHLPGLIFILIFGVFLGNLDELKKYKFIHRLHPEKLNYEVLKFKDITNETSFIVRALFFMLFGFLIDPNDVINIQNVPLSLTIVITLFIIRWVFLKLCKLPIKPLLFIAPRGLITILLFLSVIPEYQTRFVTKSHVIQVVIITILIMMFGLLNDKKKDAVDFSDEQS